MINVAVMRQSVGGVVDWRVIQLVLGELFRFF